MVHGPAAKGASTIMNKCKPGGPGILSRIKLYSLHLRRIILCCAAAGAVSSAAAGPLVRVPNTTLNMPLTPPTQGYTHKNAFGSLTFTNPIAIVTPPGETNRVFIVQKNGLIMVITNLTAPTKTLFMNIQSKVSYTDSNSGGSGEQGLLGMAFHPGYKTNRYFYVYYTGQSTEHASGLHDIIERYQTSSSNPNQGLTSTATKIISQYDRDVNHNAGDVHFGPDGYLYVSLGDEGAEHDGRTNAQHITWELFSGIIRIDVDKKSGNVAPNPGDENATTSNYLVPADNPWVGASSFDGSSVNPSQVHTEFYAVGLRNPFRFSFDPVTGGLWCGDVGQDAIEEVNYITKGGNYGWAWYEGNTTPPANMSTTGRPRPSNPIAPIIAYTHGTGTTQGNCVIGGVVYRGQKLSQLYGHYVFADYVSGNFWQIDASHTNGTISTPQPIFSDSSLHPTAFGADPFNGDVLFTAEKSTGVPSGATIERITYNTTTNGAPIPPTLADTGAFTNLMSLTGPQDALKTASGIVPYDINVPFWSDNAIKSRWFSVPKTNFNITFSPTNNWLFPTGTVWIKHFNLELTNGDPSSEIRIETRLIVKNSSGVYGVTYRWGGSQTNATLVGEGGLDEPFVIHDGGTIRTQVWHYPSRNECIQCHTPEGGFGLGFRTEQLNRNLTYPGGTDNEISALSDAGYFTSQVSDTSTLLALAHETNSSASLEFRSRSFLMANCSQCHQPGGSAVLSSWDARITTPITQQGIINGALSDNLGDANNRVIVPQDTAHSVLLTRDSTRGFNSIQMPPLDSNLVDINATNIVTQWINGMGSFWVSPAPYAKTITAGGANATFTVSSLKVPSFGGSVTLSATGLPSGITVSFSPSSITPPANSTMTVSADSSTASGTYTLNLVGTSGSSVYTAPFVVKVTGGSSSLPAPWVDADIGAVGIAGSADYSSGTFTISGSGSDIWTTADQFNYVYQPTSGDQTIVARVASEGNPQTYAKAGVMIRETTDTAAAEVSVLLTPTNGVAMQIRPATGANSINVTGWITSVQPPQWVKLVRSGDAFTASYSADGSSWTEIATTNVTMASSAIAGLAVTSHDNTQLNTATFDNVSVSTGSAPLFFEAEDLSYTTNGAAAILQTDSAASGGFWIQLMSDSVNDYIEFTTPNVAAGVYSLDFLYKAHPNRAIVSLSVDGVTQGGTLDEYSASPFYTEQNFGNVTLNSSGNHQIRLTVVGINPASGSYSVSADAFRLTFVGNAGSPTNFSLSATPSSRTIVAGGSSTNYIINSTSTNFSSSIALSVNGLPSGASGGFSPTSIVPPASSTLTVSANASTTPGTYPLTITGIGGGKTNSAPATLIINAPPPPPPTNFTLSVSPSSQSITSDGGNVSYTVNSTSTNFNSSVTLDVSGLPAGATYGFNPNPIVPPQSSALNITVASNTAAGTYSLTVSGVGGGLTRTANTTLIVNSSVTGSSTLYEAELIPSVTDGTGVSIVSDGNASGGEWISLLSTNAGPFIEFTLTNVTAGIYDLGFLYKQHPNRGILDLTVDGVQLGDSLNEYSNIVAYPEKDFGNITFTADGDHAVRLTNIGKDPSAGTPNINADAFRLTTTNEVWLSDDIGAVGIAGSFAESNGTFTVVGSGSDIWTTADQFRYAWQNVSGDIDYSALVISETQPATYAKAGVMIRASLANNSPYAAVLLTPTNGVALQIRPTTGASSINVTGWITGPKPPYWVRIVRSGNTFTGYYSADGSSWTQIAHTNITMSAGVTAGMAVTSHNNADVNTAKFQ